MIRAGGSGCRLQESVEAVPGEHALVWGRSRKGINGVRQVRDKGRGSCFKPTLLAAPSIQEMVMSDSPNCWSYHRYPNRSPANQTCSNHGGVIFLFESPHQTRSNDARSSLIAIVGNRHLCSGRGRDKHAAHTTHRVRSATNPKRRSRHPTPTSG